MAWRHAPPGNPVIPHGNRPDIVYKTITALLTWHATVSGNNRFCVLESPDWVLLFHNLRTYTYNSSELAMSTPAD